MHFPHVVKIKRQQKWILWLGKTRMAELGVWWNDLTPEFIGITVITEKSGEVSFLDGERIWQLFPPKNGLTERIS